MSKIKSYNFWIKMASAIILIARIILSKFGYELDSALVIDIATLIAGLLVVLGIINEPTGITFSYEELATNGNKNQIKGDSVMTDKIKTDLMERTSKLNDLIGNDSGSMTDIIQVLTSMLDEVLLIEEEKETMQTEETLIEKTEEDNALVIDTNQKDIEIAPIVVQEVNKVETSTEEIVEETETVSEEDALIENKINDENTTAEEFTEEIAEAPSLTAYSVALGNEDAVKMVKEYVISHIDEIIGGGAV